MASRSDVRRKQKERFSQQKVTTFDQESTTATPAKTAEKEIETAKAKPQKFMFPSNLGDASSELHSFIEFRVREESNARETIAGMNLSEFGTTLFSSNPEEAAAKVEEIRKEREQANANQKGRNKTGSSPNPPDEVIIKSTNRVTTKETIRLFIPENIAMPTTAQYDSNTLGTFGAGLTSALGGNFADLKDVGAGGNFLESLKAELTQTGGNLLGGGAGDVINQAVFGRAANAAKYLTFKGIEFRKFQFQYNLVPQSRKESEDLDKIIKTFRQAMLPNIISTGFYDIPQSFDIEYVIKNSDGKEVIIMHKFKPCNLEECNVTYGANGRYTLTKDGYPANIQLSLTFSENEQVTRDDIPLGF